MGRRRENMTANLAALATMSRARLRETWAAMERTPPPNLPPALLRRFLAQRLQERRFGALTTLFARELERAARGKPLRWSARREVTLTPGTRLVREWNGQTIAVEVREDGFAWKDRTWRSLSEIAREVTGAHWSGPRFFGTGRRG
jgi:hypothetical protein